MNNSISSNIILREEEDEKENDKKSETEGYKTDAYKYSFFISKLFFYWAFKIIFLTRKIPLNVSHLGPLGKTNDSKSYSTYLLTYWEEKGYKNKKNNALFKAVLSANKYRILFLSLLSFLGALMDFIEIFLVKYIIDSYNNKNVTLFGFSINNIAIIGIILLVSQFLNIFFANQSYMIGSLYGERASNELNCLVYHKILKSSPSSFDERATQGEILNFIQIDSDKLNNIIFQCPKIFVNPFLIAGYIYLIYSCFGIWFLIEVGIVIIVLFSALKIYQRFGEIDQEVLAKKDKRMSLTTELFANIKILKMYGWEKEFANRVIDKRTDEVKSIGKEYNLSVLGLWLFWFCPILCSLIIILICQFSNGKFNVGNMLIGVSLINMLQEPMCNFPMAISAVFESLVSMERIEKYLKQRNRDDSIIIKKQFDQYCDYSIKIKGATFTWGKKQKNQLEEEEKEKSKGEKTKKDITIKDNNNKNDSERKLLIEENGKNEIQTENKNIEESLKFPLIFNDIENSDKSELYNPNINIPKDCDFDIVLDNINLQIEIGDLVGIIGEVGSGKSSLLQAMLNSLILLNPKECDGIYINGSIGYVSQQPWIINATIRDNITLFSKFESEKYSKVLEMSHLYYDLKILDAGDLTEIGEKGVNLSGGQKVRIAIARVLYANPDIYLFDDPISALDANIGDKIMKKCIISHLNGKTRIVVTHALFCLQFMNKIIYLNKGRIEWVGTYDELQKQSFYEKIQNSSKLYENKENIKEQQSEENQLNLSILIDKEDYTDLSTSLIKGITSEEKFVIGGVKWVIYIKYLKYLGGNCFILIIILFLFLYQGTRNTSDVWLAFWSQSEGNIKKWVGYGVYTGLGISSALFIFLRIYLSALGTMKMCNTVHKEMIEALIAAPINLFHETVPRGQIFNRLSKDLEEVQYSMYPVGDFLMGGMNIIGEIAVCSIFDPYSLITIPIFAIAGWYLTKFYLQASRQLSRLKAISLSPILNTINESVSGISSILAYEKEEMYKDRFYNNINNSYKISIFLSGIEKWYTQEFDFLSFLYMLYLIILIINHPEYSIEKIAIISTYSLALQKSLSYAFTKTAGLETQMVSMERCVEYTNILSENPNEMEKDQDLINSKWPTQGKIEFDNYSVRYRPNTEIVLKHLSFKINPHEKIGIVGRTGSGKSTICLSLFRILEPFNGTILIDDVDICSIGLDLLRNNLTLIPQDPCIFSGTVKYNIDPLNQYDDIEIKNVIKQIGLNLPLEEENDVLDKVIEQNGDNLSVGEKQLICIARAIMRNTKIIVMDEATANIDVQTEEKIQNAINTLMNNSTIITIAHRIKTVINYDRIMVLVDGEVVEFDTPKKLLENNSSIFFQLYSKSTN